MSQKDQIEALRKRGLEWTDGKPLLSLKPKWLPYVRDAGWLRVERWIDLANRLPPDETLETLSPEEAAEHLGFVNFGIRGYQMVDPDYLVALVRNVRWTLEAMASRPRPAGIEHFEPDPWILFTMALSLIDPGRLKWHCSACNRLFFGKRKDQKACSLSCSNTARQRKFREKHYYNENRKKNREAKAERERRVKQAILSALRKDPR